MPISNNGIKLKMTVPINIASPWDSALMHLLLYDIEAKKDPHGIRIRLVRALRKSGAYQLHRSAWVINELSDALIGVIKEYRNAGGSVKITEWLPRMIGEVSPAKVSLLKVTIAVNGGTQ